MLGTERLFEQALGITAPWSVKEVLFDAAARQLTIAVDFASGGRFAHPAHPGEHPVHDTQLKRLRHLNFFQHDRHLDVRVPRVRLPAVKVVPVEPPYLGCLSGLTLLFEALVLALAREMPFAAIARLVGESWHRVHATGERYVERAVAELDPPEVRALAIEETSYRRGHRYLTVAADAVERRVLFVTEGRDADTAGELAEHLRSHQAKPEQIDSVSIDMSPAFIKGRDRAPAPRPHHLDKFHVVAHASAAVDAMRRLEQRGDSSLKGLRWTLLKDRHQLSAASRAELDTLIAQVTSKRTARAWVYREQLREVLDCKQINVVSAMLAQWCTNVMRSKVEPMKEVAKMIRRHFDGIVAWTQTRQTNGFLEALNGLFQAAKRKARGYGRLRTMRTVLFLIAGKLDFARLNPHAR